SVDTLSEGTDLPEVACVVLARPTASLALHVQQGMRCMTPHEGKPRPVVLDVAGNTLRHGFAYDDRAWSLERKTGVKREGGGAPVKRCPQCRALAPPRASTCGGCGRPFAIEVASVPQAPPPEKLVEVRLTTEQIERKRRELERFAAA